jgi:hypothetical protein
MMIKEFALITVMLSICVPALAADMPDMVGNWTGTLSSVGWNKNTHWMASEHFNYWEENNTLVIEEQNGTRFAGRLISAINPSTTMAVMGVFDSENESITLVDEDGFLWGYMVSPTEMELYDQELDMDSMHVGGGLFTKE